MAERTNHDEPIKTKIVMSYYFAAFTTMFPNFIDHLRNSDVILSDFITFVETPLNPPNELPANSNYASTFLCEAFVMVVFLGKPVVNEAADNTYLSRRISAITKGKHDRYPSRAQSIVIIRKYWENYPAVRRALAYFLTSPAAPQPNSPYAAKIKDFISQAFMILQYAEMKLYHNAFAICSAQI